REHRGHREKKERFCFLSLCSLCPLWPLCLLLMNTNHLCPRSETKNATRSSISSLLNASTYEGIGDLLHVLSSCTSSLKKEKTAPVDWRSWMEKVSSLMRTPEMSRPSLVMTRT